MQTLRRSCKLFSFFLALSLLFSACKAKIDAPQLSKGTINPTTYVAIGNSITAGYADNALYADGQLVSYPNLIATQLKLVGGGNFAQPMMPAGSVGVSASGKSKWILGYATDCLGATSLMPVDFAPSGDVAALNTNIYASQGPFNNMGVPGTRSFQFLQPGYGSATGNPFFRRMTSNPATASVESDALAMNPTFFTAFVGNNDVLMYAMNGGASDSITSQATFAASLNSILAPFILRGAKGVIATIPDVTALPYFTTIPYNGLTLRQGQADSLNASLPGLFNFKAGPNPFIIADASVVPLGARQIKPGELILLDVPLDSIKCHGMGSLTPIPDKYVLNLNEISSIQQAVIGYNVAIRIIAAQSGLAVADVNAFMNKAQKGITYNGVGINTQFVTGGAFSLDGIHLNPIGNAMLANEFLSAMNLTFGANIPLVDVTKYRGVVFP